MKPFFLAFAALTFFSAVATAQTATPLGADSDAPVEISAAKSLEWNRKARTYTARQDAVAKQGNLEVKSDTLTAHYTEGSGVTSINELIASGNVRISSPPYTAAGERAVYNVTGQTAVLTGGTLKIETPTEFLTARDKIEFDVGKNRLSAVGAAKAVRGTDSLTSDTLHAFFRQDATGKMALQRIQADQPVTIKTARETVNGDKGTYDVGAGKATLTGNVRILQGENWIEGDRAEVDLKTGVSQLFADKRQNTLDKTGADADNSGRVKGVFYPKKKAPAPEPQQLP